MVPYPVSELEPAFRHRKNCLKKPDSQMEGSCNITANLQGSVSPCFLPRRTHSHYPVTTHEERGLPKKTIGHRFQFDIHFRRLKTASSLHPHYNGVIWVLFTGSATHKEVISLILKCVSRRTYLVFGRISISVPWPVG